MEFKLSIVIPAKNEAKTLKPLITKIKTEYPSAEVIVVNDGSSDATAEISRRCGAIVVNHVYSKGNGAAVKTGARVATGDVLLLMDADGQHRVDHIPRLLAKYAEGYDMVVGSRSRKSQASILRWIGNGIYNRLATWVVGHRVLDLTSGFRVVNLRKFKEFIELLPNGFSYPTTSTMAFFRAGYSVGYEEVEVEQRVGNSHISLWKDGGRFFLIIFKLGTLYSPLKIFFPISLFFMFSGLIFFSYTYFMDGRFTNMSALLMTTAILIFLIGLVSEQITALLYVKNKTE